MQKWGIVLTQVSTTLHQADAKKRFAGETFRDNSLFNDYFTGHALVAFAAKEIAMKFIGAGLWRHDAHPRDFWGHFKM